jgi:glutamyl-Q tRNA(Asp) synthetase
MTKTTAYTGRFAPSPSGPLHFGSLVAAVASYLDARANHGIWLVRMEDLDPAREPPGAAATILEQLADYGMVSDKPVLYQSQRLEAYQAALDFLEDAKLCYRCICSRQQVRAMGSVYDGSCRTVSHPRTEPSAIRVMVDDQTIEFEDLIQGHQAQSLSKETGDFIIRRKDGLFAYQLAVVVDDSFQGVSHVIRGYDLLESTPRQIYLQHRLGYATPRYGHVPVITNEMGQKLSKQHFADPLSSTERRSIMHAAITYLGLEPPRHQHELQVEEQLDWAIEHWDIQAIPRLAAIQQHQVIS